MVTDFNLEKTVSIGIYLRRSNLPFVMEMISWPMAFLNFPEKVPVR